MAQRRFRTQYHSSFINKTGAPPHFHHDVRGYLNDTLPHRQIGRASQDDSPLLPRPPRSADLTLCDFFLWGYVKDHVFVPPMPSIQQNCDKGLSVQSLVLAFICWHVYGRSWIIGSMSAESPTVGIWNVFKVCIETLRDRSTLSYQKWLQRF